MSMSDHRQPYVTSSLSPAVLTVLGSRFSSEPHGASQRGDPGGKQKHGVAGTTAHLENITDQVLEGLIRIHPHLWFLDGEWGNQVRGKTGKRVPVEVPKWKVRALSPSRKGEKESVIRLIRKDDRGSLGGSAA